MPEIVTTGGEGDVPISVGEVVTWIPDLMLRSETLWRLQDSCPDARSKRAITCTGLKVLSKNTNGSLNKTVSSNRECCLSADALKDGPRRKPITLPALQPQG